MKQAHMSSVEDRLLFNYRETKSKKKKNQKEEKQKQNCEQSVRYRFWKQGNIKMTMSEDQASCCIQTVQ